MKKIFSTNYSATGLNFVTLLLRVVFGLLMMIPHGYAKLVNFDKIAPKFMNFMGLGQTASLGLVIFAEFFCSLALILGLFTRLALVPLIVAASVIVFRAHAGDILGEAEHGFLYLTVYFVLMVTGPGKYSVDGMIARK